MSRYTNEDGASVNISDYVHEVAGRWIIAEWVEHAAQYQAPVKPVRGDDVFAYAARNIEDVARNPRVRKYRSKSGAVRAACETYDLTPPKRGRPSSDSSLTELVQFRVSRADKAAIDDAARRAGLPVADWARARLVGELGSPL